MTFALLGRKGAIKGYVTVDADVYGWASKHRWCLVGSPGRQLVARLTGKGGDRQFLHRMILGVPNGDPRIVDHIDGDILNCRRANLRCVTRTVNAQNRRSVPGSSSRYRGVSFVKRTGRWDAKCQINGREFYIGQFDDEHAAGEAALEYRLKHMPGAVAITGR